MGVWDRQNSGWGVGSEKLGLGVESGCGVGGVKGRKSWDRGVGSEEVEVGGIEVKGLELGGTGGWGQKSWGRGG